MLGAKKDYPLLVDETMELWDVISISAGLRRMQVLLAPEDHVRVTKATVGRLGGRKWKISAARSHSYPCRRVRMERRFALIRGKRARVRRRVTPTTAEKALYHDTPGYRLGMR